MISSEIKKRVIKEANYIINTKQTIRSLADTFNISKSTVHKDLRERLKIIDINKYNKIKLIMDEHIKTRHIKGGESTKLKYLNS